MKQVRMYFCYWQQVYSSLLLLSVFVVVIDVSFVFFFFFILMTYGTFIWMDIKTLETKIDYIQRNKTSSQPKCIIRCYSLCSILSVYVALGRVKNSFVYFSEVRTDLVQANHSYWCLCHFKSCTQTFLPNHSTSHIQ